jgi:hypothetical protein
LRKVVTELRNSPDYDHMSPTLAQAVRTSLPATQTELASLGEEQSVDFTGIGSRGEDVYAVHFSNGGDAEWRILPGDDGTITMLEHHTFKRATPLPVSNISAVRTKPGGSPTTLEFLNRTNDPLQVYWIDPEGQTRRQGTVEAHHIKTQPTYSSEVWMLGKDEHHPTAVFIADPGLTVATIN